MRPGQGGCVRRRLRATRSLARWCAVRRRRSSRGLSRRPRISWARRACQPSGEATPEVIWRPMVGRGEIGLQLGRARFSRRRSADGVATASHRPEEEPRRCRWVVQPASVNPPRASARAPARRATNGPARPAERHWSYGDAVGNHMILQWARRSLSRRSERDPFQPSPRPGYWPLCNRVASRGGAHGLTMWLINDVTRGGP
jgi:hypothetical protein